MSDAKPAAKAKKKPAPTKDPKGGLTAAGRKKFKETEGANLKPGVKEVKTPDDRKRKGSFLRRHYATLRGPLQDDDGNPTRLALQAQAWGEKVPKTEADAKKLAEKGTKLLEQYKKEKDAAGGTAKTAAKPRAKKTAASAKKSSESKSEDGGRSRNGTYTDPALREKLKGEITAGDKGGKPGQWSARKAQLLAREYEKAGGGYAGAKTDAQKHLDRWTGEKWTTADGEPAARGGETARYLPEKAWDELSPAEKRATDRKKRTASRGGEQFVANTAKAKAARKKSGGG